MSPDRQQEEIEKAKEHVLSQYVDENVDSYVAAKAAVTQAELIEDFYQSYTSAREMAQKEADQVRRRRLEEGTPSEVME